MNTESALNANRGRARSRAGRVKGFWHRLRSLVPTRDEARPRGGLRWLGPLLDREWLWHLNRRTVASGAALGVFFGIIIPVAQMPFAAAAAILLRANLPIAILCTLVSNPFTFAPIYWLAHRMGSVILEPADRSSSPPTSGDGVEAADVPTTFADWIERMADFGAPLMLGLSLFAAGGALFTYVAVRVVWRLQVVWQQQRHRADDT